MCICETCGHELSDEYVRVVLPDGAESVEMCPRCPSDERREVSGIWRNKLNKTNKTGV